MRLKIITPTGTLYEGEVEKVELPSVQGRMQVLRDHAPLLAALEAGAVVTGDERYEIEGGVARVEKNEILVCTL